TFVFAFLFASPLGSRYFCALSATLRKSTLEAAVTTNTSETVQSSQVPVRSDKEGLELQHLQVEVEKLSLEVAALRSSTFWYRTIGRYLPLLTAILAVAGFWVGLFQYFRQQTETERQRADAVQQRSEELRREAAKPFWDSQLQLYLRASEAAAIIATSSD